MNNIRDSDKGATKEKSSNKAPQPAKQERQKSLDHKLTKLIIAQNCNKWKGFFYRWPFRLQERPRRKSLFPNPYKCVEYNKFFHRLLVRNGKGMNENTLQLSTDFNTLFFMLLWQRKGVTMNNYSTFLNNGREGIGGIRPLGVPDMPPVTKDEAPVKTIITSTGIKRINDNQILCKEDKKP